MKRELLEFEPLTKLHVKKMCNWGLHDSPLFEDYNFDFKTNSEINNFYYQKVLPRRNKYFAIIYDGEMIGYVGLKKIDRIFRTAVLGLVLNPDLVGMGFGTLALSEFLYIYFYKMNMRKMILTVAKYNIRALKLYKKMGFVIKKEFLEEYPNGSIDENSFDYISHRDSFVKRNGILYNYVYEMELSGKDFDFEI